MIRLVRGTVLARGKDYLIVDMGSSTGGLGLKVFAPEPTLAQFNSGIVVTLHTYLQVREDALTLYGFAEEDELGMFELLLTVSGVGPKVALSILSTLSPDALRLALANDEPAIVARAPGVGKRTAQKIVLDLKDKVGGSMTGIEALAMSSDADSQVIEALTGLGYSVVEAQRAVQKLPKDLVGVEERLRYALSQFGG
ncbi:MAG: Holliday junction branch migration protein RuvA [Chloroflexi bacterium]|nr:Holliday junction branch migration protein RuvA [Chloroflexota bacterium]